MPSSSNPIILLIAEDAGCYHLMDLLLADGFKVFSCDNATQACHFMVERSVDLVLIDTGIPNEQAYVACRSLRRTSSVNMYPIIMIGHDDGDGSVTAAAYEAGADDFVSVPFARQALVARLHYHLESIKRLQAVSSITANASSAELAMILQFLEAELKTGRVIVKRQGSKAVLYLKEGKLLHAEARGFLGLEAVVEVLSWASSTATFVDDDTVEGDLEQATPLTEVITKALGKVAEYRAARRRLPPVDTVFTAGTKKLPTDLDKVHRFVYEHALTGYTVEEILLHPDQSTRQMTVALLNLVESGQLITADPLFLDFTWNVYHSYRKPGLIKTLRQVKAALAAIEFPLNIYDDSKTEDDAEKSWVRPRPPGRRRRRLPPAVANWQEIAPKLIVTGNQATNAATFIDSLGMLHSAVNQTAPAHFADLAGIKITRLELVDGLPLDLVELPPVMDRSKLRWLDQHGAELFGVILISADQTSEENKQNLRLLRQLWARFKGLYYLIVPKLLNYEEKAFFLIDCPTCGHQMSVNMDRTGETDACSACHAAITIPDCLDYLARELALPEDVPILQLKTNRPEPARDLFELLCETVVSSAEANQEPNPEWTNETWAL